jgi:hypothetical protein
MNCVMNRLAIVVLLIGVVVARTSLAQFSIDLKQGNADYPVPVPAALYALHTGSPLYLEPMTVRGATFSAQELCSFSGSRFSVGTEIAPVLIGNAIDLSKYLSGRLIRVLLRTRFSVGITSLGNNRFNTALGLRWMAHDDADPRADSSFERALIAWGEQDTSIATVFDKTTFNQLRGYHSHLTKTIASRKSMQAKIDSLRDALKARLWNKSVFEVAVAAVYHSAPDSNNTVPFIVRRYNAFLNAALPLNHNTMIHLGASGQVGFDDDRLLYQRQGAFITRLYYGSVTERGYGGFKFAATNIAVPDYRIEMGALLKIANGLWLRPEYSVSANKHPYEASQASITLSFGTPEMRAD